MNTITAVIFDLDDTLYSERAFALSGFRAVAEAYADLLGHPGKAAVDMSSLLDAGRRGSVFNALLAQRGLKIDHEIVTRMVQIYRTHAPSIELHPDADAALTRLGKTYRLGLITDGPVEMQSNKIDALDLAGRFERVILTAELGPDFGKPHPRAFELMAEGLDVPHHACVYIADNAAKDFIAPNKLGWRTIQILRTDGIYRTKPPAPGGKPQHVVATLDEVETAWTGDPRP